MEVQDVEAIDDRARAAGAAPGSPAFSSGGSARDRGCAPRADRARGAAHRTRRTMRSLKERSSVRTKCSAWMSRSSANVRRSQVRVRQQAEDAAVDKRHVYWRSGLALRAGSLRPFAYVRCTRSGFVARSVSLTAQSETASSPGTIGRVRGSRPRRARLPTHSRMPTKIASLIASGGPRPRQDLPHEPQHRLRDADRPHRSVEIAALVPFALGRRASRAAAGPARRAARSCRRSESTRLRRSAAAAIRRWRWRRPGRRC